MLLVFTFNLFWTIFCHKFAPICVRPDPHYYSRTHLQHLPGFKPLCQFLQRKWSICNACEMLFTLPFVPKMNTWLWHMNDIIRSRNIGNIQCLGDSNNLWKYPSSPYMDITPVNHRISSIHKVAPVVQDAKYSCRTCAVKFWMIFYQWFFMLNWDIYSTFKKSYLSTPKCTLH